MQVSEYKNIFLNEDSHFYYRGTHNTVLGLLNKYSPKNKKLKILDAGCGTGLLMKKLEKYGDVFGVDISPEAIKYTKRRRIKNACLASIEKLPFKDNYFDIIVSVDVLYHQRVGNDIKALREFNRVLESGGILIVKVPAFNWLRGSHDIVVETRHRYTKKELGGKLKVSGFEVMKLSYANMTVFPIALLKRITERFQKNHSTDVVTVPDFLNKTLVNIMEIEDKLMAFYELPFGLSVFAVAQKSDSPDNVRVPI